MANCWTDEYAIWRDLSVAQGREVPVDIDRSVTVAQNEPPPSIYIPEETEEEFLSPYVGGGDTSCGPDLDLICKMLKEVNKSTDEQSSEEYPSPSLVHTENSTSPSLVCNGNSTNPILVPGSSISMFRRKNKDKPLDNPTYTPRVIASETRVDYSRSFVPTDHAAELYNRYNEQSQELQRQRENIWTRLERQMKELDEKKRQQMAERRASESSSSNSDAHGVEFVRLAAHRHMYVEAKDCIVCEVMCRKRDKSSGDT